MSNLYIPTIEIVETVLVLEDNQGTALRFAKELRESRPPGKLIVDAAFNVPMADLWLDAHPEASAVLCDVHITSDDGKVVEVVHTIDFVTRRRVTHPTTAFIAWSDKGLNDLVFFPHLCQYRVDFKDRNIQQVVEETNKILAMRREKLSRPIPPTPQIPPALA
jgi:hypothetical protein